MGQCIHYKHKDQESLKMSERNEKNQALAS